MARVVASCSSIRAFAGGVSEFQVEADTVEQLIATLDRRHAGLGEHIRKHLAIVVDGEIRARPGKIALTASSEIVLIPRISGG